MLYRGLSDLQRLQLISANGAAVASTATPAASKKSTPIGAIIGGSAVSSAVPCVQATPGVDTCIGRCIVMQRVYVAIPDSVQCTSWV